MTIDAATEGFVRSFCRLRSVTYPYLPRREGGLWIMQDHPPRKKQRKIEVVACGIAPEDAVRTVKDLELGWHFMVAVHEREDEYAELRRAYKRLGYRALATEWIFVHDHAHIPHFETDVPVRLVDSPETLASIRQVARQPRKLLPDTRLYGVWDETRDYGWVRSMPEGEYGWASDLYVYAESRGRGFGRALMSRLLQDDRAAGLHGSALIASSAGARLYPHLGYRQIGFLQIFSPQER